MEFVEYLTHKHMLIYSQAMRKNGGETLQGYEYINAQITSAIEAGIITGVESLETMKPYEVMEAVKEVRRLYSEAITPDTKN